MSSELAGLIRPRPLRFAFLVEDGEHSHLALDGIFADCYNRWGGRFSLIVPCRDDRILPSYWPWLQAYDPDIVYSYVPLSRDDILELHERIYPAQYAYHELGQELRLDLFGFKPSYRFEALSSLSTIFRLARHSPTTAGKAPVQIVNSWHTETASRFLTDNFGTYLHSRGGEIYPPDALATASLLTIVSPRFREDHRYGVPRDLNSIPDEMTAFREFASLRATSLSLLSANLAPKLDIEAHSWSWSFNLVVGESFTDRILFWNARLFIPGWLGSDLSCWRVNLDQMRDPEFLAILGDLLKRRNHVRGHNNQPQITVRSTSLEASQLEEARQLLLSTKPWGVVEAKAVELESLVPSPAALQSARQSNRFGGGFFNPPEWQRFMWTPPTARPPISAPDHLADSPSRQAFTAGYWATDLSLELDGPGPHFTNENRWMLPRRWRMTGAFKAIVANPSPLAGPMMTRRSRDGNLALVVCADYPIETITVPTVYEAMQYALAVDGARTNANAEHGDVRPPNKLAWIHPGNEARYLTGVLGMTGGLAAARAFLLHPFLREQFAKLGGAPNPPAEQIEPTVNRLLKHSRRQASFDLKNEREREALARWIVRAAREIKGPMEYVNYDRIKKAWKTYRATFWEKNPHQRDSDSDVDWDKHEEDSLNRCLVEMRHRQMLYQGYRWTCRKCHHRNWVNLDSLSSELFCNICKEPTPAPVDIQWIFRPNAFLIESLRDRSVLSLIWALSALCLRSRHSFAFVEPTWLGFHAESNATDAEADLLLVVDGRAVLCEVKSSWRDLRTSDLNDFVTLAHRLRPDAALLAVMERGSGPTAELATARKQLGDDGIEFEVLTPDAYEEKDDPYLEHSH